MKPRRSAEAAGIYLHMPYCSAICPYCDFAVRVGGRDKHRAFVEALIDEMGLYGATILEFDTIYFGGGTPSLFAPEDLGRILDAIRSIFRLRSDTWIFLEANPEDVSVDSLTAWLRLGVKTLSLGVQSFEAEDLEFLGRRHGAAQARRSVELALAAGFETVSVDLIYGRPGQDVAAWRRTLAKAVSLEPHHLSCYELTIHDKTTFGKRLLRGELTELAEDVKAELFLFTHNFLNAAGYPGYEVSNFARDPAHHSRHNLKYWSHTPYLGFGPSAHSFDGRRRWWSERLLPRWQAKVCAGHRAEAGSELLTPQQLATEALMLGLRTCAGIDLKRFRERYGVDLGKVNRLLIDVLAAQGQLRVESKRIIPTVRGLAIADKLASAFEVE
ncbi:MAG: radical SAM family heme chaperone HemW [bacterium]|nr:radical SAM family heme chaperone HemW [bacterium]